MKPMLSSFWKPQKKAVTLMGMSGMGKTYMSCQLADWGWRHYSCDYEIATKYLRTELGLEGQEVSMDDIRKLSDFVGQMGDESKGGLPLGEFRRRQQMYYDSEVKALQNAIKEAQDCRANFVNDSTGSICEIEDEDLIADVCRTTLLVYIEASKEEEAEVLQRARDYPKPLFFPAAFFEEKLDEYMRENVVATPDAVDPSDFSRWVFPHLFAARKPKYLRLAREYGVTIPSSAFKNIRGEDDFIALVEGALREAA